MTVENLTQTIDSADSERFFGGDRKVRRELSGPNSAQDPDLKGSPAVLGADQGKSFSDILRNSVEKVNEMQAQADTAIKELVAGRSKNIHETMLTIERADTSLKLMMQVRNKILDAYREIMRMQV
ncbi:MAG: flagellar hook-basal body complex protein FliE [Bdellovibrio sp.]|nr:flagellar hook-basal body complex protein FliE [Bdellovibrio sp.]